MEATRSLRRHGNVQPGAFSLLSNLPPGSVKHAEHGLRPPGGIYNVSMGRVLSAFEATLDQLEALRSAPADAHGGIAFKVEPLIAAQVELLESMMAHIDDGYQVLKACHPPNPSITEPFAHKWLEKARHPSVKQFKNAVSGYRDAIAPMGNRIKHEHGQLRLVVFYGGEQRIAGYYLEAIDREGVAGADAKIHPGDTAFSFNRDLRFHFVHLFEIGDALRAALTSALQAMGIRSDGRLVVDESARLIAVAERVEALSTTVFPDEVAKPAPHVRVERDQGDVVLSVRYPSLATFRQPGEMRITTTIQGDGYTTSYRMPYFPKRPVG